MKAAVNTGYGPPEVVRVTEVDKPAPKPGELLVRVRATTVNRTDCGFRAGKPFIVRFFSGLRTPKVKVLGNEFAGEVEVVGAGVTAFEVGDRVFGYNEGPFGGHAEYMTIAEDSWVATMPAGSSFVQAAPSLEGSHYALAFLRTAKVRGRQAILVYGATGAIGSAAVQLAKALGAEVTAVCATAHIKLVEGLGADRVIDYRAEDFTQDEQTYDVVVDAVGKSTFGRCKRLLKPGGIYLSSDLGPLAQNPFLALVTPLLRGRHVKFPLPTNADPEGASNPRQALVRYFKERIEAREFRPLIDRTYSLDQIVEAYRYVETGQKVGNVVITLGPDGEAAD